MVHTMSFGLVFMFAVSFVVLALVLRSVQVVPATQVAVVERLGKFSHTLKPGVHLVVPIVDHIRQRVSTAEQVIELHDEPLIGSDDHLVHANVRCAVMVVDPARAVYEVPDPIDALRTALRTHLRERVGTMTADEAVARGATRIVDARMHLEPLAQQWGMRINSVDGAISRRAG